MPIRRGTGWSPGPASASTPPERLIVPTLHRLPATPRHSALDAAVQTLAGIEYQDRVPWGVAADRVVLALGDAEPGSADTLTA
ncbi:hypothetical protein AB0903_24710 [Streptomyces sp. NPDC048389]|uniref:hypothetical protein n=1 Tax=Streptomyces sp. NPDC048389 TaxID=3154622 RepID=UPI0034554BEB